MIMDDMPLVLLNDKGSYKKERATAPTSEFLFQTPKPQCKTFHAFLIPFSLNISDLPNRFSLSITTSLFYGIAMLNCNAESSF